MTLLSASRASRALGVAATFAALGAARAWHNPSPQLGELAASPTTSRVVMTSGAVFEFGSYPDEHRLAELKRQGITTVISLQHPDVVVERAGIAEERAATAKIGLKFVNAPMLLDRERRPQTWLRLRASRSWVRARRAAAPWARRLADSISRTRRDVRLHPRG